MSILEKMSDDLVNDPVGSVTKIFGGVALVMAVPVVGAFTYIIISEKMDAPLREPIAAEIVDRSLLSCANADQNRALYAVNLKSGLNRTQSEELKKLMSPATPTLCVEPAFNDVSLLIKQDANDAAIQREHNIVGAVYTHPDGAKTFVVKAPDEDGFITSGIRDVLDAMHDMPKDAPQKILEDGTHVALYLLNKPVSYHKNANTWTEWAEQPRIEEIGKNVSLAWPLKGPAPTGF